MLEVWISPSARRIAEGMGVLDQQGGWEGGCWGRAYAPPSPPPERKLHIKNHFIPSNRVSQSSFQNLVSLSTRLWPRLLYLLIGNRL